MHDWMNLIDALGSLCNLSAAVLVLIAVRNGKGTGKS
jgi:hypothetical protein